MLNYHEVTTADAGFLYDLLNERPDYANISHKALPQWLDHLKFVAGRPYKRWLVATRGDVKIGAAYVTNNDEIGIAIKKEHQGKGYGKQIVQHFIYNHGVRYANIAPNNKASRKLFEKMGFKLIQEVYVLDSQNASSP